MTGLGKDATGATGIGVGKAKGAACCSMGYGRAATATPVDGAAAYSPAMGWGGAGPGSYGGGGAMEPILCDEGTGEFLPDPSSGVDRPDAASRERTAAGRFSSAFRRSDA